MENGCSRISVMFLAACCAFMLLADPSAAMASSPEQDANLVGTMSPRFTATDIHGEQVSLAHLMKDGKSVLLNFWGLRCGACIEEMPHLRELFRKYRGKVTVIGVNVDAVDGVALREYMNNEGLEMEYHVVPDPEFKLIDLFKMTVAPLTILIDSKGMIRFRHENYMAGDEVKLEEAIGNVLEQMDGMEK